MIKDFSVQPTNILPGLQMLGRGLERRGQRKLEEAKEKKNLQLRQDLTGVLQKNDPDALMEFVGKNPGAKEVFDEMLGAEKEYMLDASRRWLINNENPADIHIEGAEKALAEGRDPEISMYMAQSTMSPANREKAKKQHEMVLAFLDPKGYKVYKGGISRDVAGIKEFEYLTEGLSPDEISNAKRIKLGLSPRATESAAKKAEKAFAEQSAKLQAKYNLEPKVAGAVTAAKNEASARVKEAGVVKSNKTAWDVYDSAMSNLTSAMGGTETGPVVGLIPAVTQNQQIAEGAVAVMAPVLKQMFRAAGEGIFTDKDQELLMKMVPTRKDLPEARVAKIKAIDSVVRAKLGIQEQQTSTLPGEGTQQVPGVPSQDEFLEKARQVNPGVSDQELLDYYLNKYGRK